MAEPDVTLITPLCGQRHQHVLRLLERWIANQTYRGRVQWILSDDGPEPILPRMGQQHIRRQRFAREPRHTLCLNLLEAIPHVRAEKVLIPEVDDWYGPDYVARMVRLLDRYPLVGEGDHRIYHVPSGGYHQHKHDWHAILAQTGLRAEYLPFLAEQCRARDYHHSLDLRLWREFDRRWPGRMHVFYTREDERFFVGLKGMCGERHVHPYHRPVVGIWGQQPGDDADRTWLRRMLGREDAEAALAAARRVKDQSVLPARERPAPAAMSQ